MALDQLLRRLPTPAHLTLPSSRLASLHLIRSTSTNHLPCPPIVACRPSRLPQQRVSGGSACLIFTALIDTSVTQHTRSLRKETCCSSSSGGYGEWCRTGLCTTASTLLFIASERDSGPVCHGAIYACLSSS